MTDTEPPRECLDHPGWGECLWYGACQQTMRDCPGMTAVPDPSNDTIEEAS